MERDIFAKNISDLTIRPVSRSTDLIHFPKRTKKKKTFGIMASRSFFLNKQRVFLLNARNKQNDESSAVG